MNRVSFAALAEGISAHVNRRPTVYLVVFSVVYFAFAAALAATRPLWHDELFTAYLVRVPSVKHLWAGLASGIDLMPPLYHLVLRLLAPIFGDGPIVLRLPSMVGFWVMCLCVYRFVSYRLPVEFGFAAMLLPFCTNASYYLAEARPYGMALGLGGLALVSWQSLDRPSRLRPLWLVCLALSLTAAITTHFYSVFLLLPLVVGEIARTTIRRAVDWKSWLAVTGPIVVLLPLWPLLSVAREFAARFWSQPTIGGTLLVYNNWLGHSDWVFLALLALAALSTLIGRPPSTVRKPNVPAADVYAATAFLALPAIAALIAFVTGSGLSWRYVIQGIIGFSILGAYVLALAFEHSFVLRVTMLGALALNHNALFTTRDLLTGRGERPLSARLQDSLLAMPDRDAPIVISSPHQFLEVLYYAPSELAKRIRYVADPELAIRYLGSDTADRGLVLLANAVPIPVGRYPDDLPADRDYFVADSEPLNWIVRQLAKSKVLTLVSAGDVAIYKVRQDPR